MPLALFKQNKIFHTYVNKQLPTVEFTTLQIYLNYYHHRIIDNLKPNLMYLFIYFI